MVQNVNAGLNMAIHTWVHVLKTKLWMQLLRATPCPK